MNFSIFCQHSERKFGIRHMKRHAHEKDDNGRKVSAADDDDGELPMFVKLLGASCVFFLSSGLVAGTSGGDGKGGLLRNYHLLFVGRIQWRV